MDIFKHTAKIIKKIKRADESLPEVYGTTLISPREERQLFHCRRGGFIRGLLQYYKSIMPFSTIF